MNLFLSEKQIATLKEIIQDQLTRRGFHAPITSIKEVISITHQHRVEFSTESFQTVPVLFKSIVVTNFNSGVAKVEDEDGKIVYEGWISVMASFKHFSGGNNGANLFSLNYKADLEGRQLWATKLSF